MRKEELHATAGGEGDREGGGRGAEWRGGRGSEVMAEGKKEGR